MLKKGIFESKQKNKQTLEQNNKIRFSADNSRYFSWKIHSLDELVKVSVDNTSLN
jgi:cytochrome c oxidase assembly protein Cox11